MKVVISNRSIDIYGFPTLQELVTIINALGKAEEYQNYHVITGKQDPIDKGISEALGDIEKGVIDNSKDYFAGCDPEEVQKAIDNLMRKNA